MSIRKLVSIKRAITDAAGDVNMKDMRIFPLLMRWAEDAERKIGSFYALKRKPFECAVNSDCHTVDLPCGVEAVLGVILGDMSTCNCDFVFRNSYNYYGMRGSAGSAYWSSVDSNFISTPGIRQWELHDDRIVFLNPLSVENIVIDTACRVMDEDGKFMMVPEEHLDAISSYIKLMLAERTRFFPAEQRMDHGDLQRLGRAWERQMRNARAQTSDPTPAERAEIVAMFNNPLSGYAGAVWRNYDEFTSYYRI